MRVYIGLYRPATIVKSVKKKNNPKTKQNDATYLQCARRKTKFGYGCHTTYEFLNCFNRGCQKLGANRFFSITIGFPTLNWMEFLPRGHQDIITCIIYQADITKCIIYLWSGDTTTCIIYRREITTCIITQGRGDITTCIIYSW